MTAVRADWRLLIAGSYPEAMMWTPRARRAAGAAALCAALLTSACSPDSSAPQEDAGQDGQEQQNQDPIPEPEFDDDETVALPIGLISPAGHNEIAPIGEDGRIVEPQSGPGYPGQQNAPRPHQTEVARSDSFGCGNTVSVVQTVPTVTDDPARSALEYLLSLDSSGLGRPAFGNPLGLSSEVQVESVEVSGETVTVALSDVPVARDSCEAWRVTKQIEATARAATGTTAAEVMVGDTPLAAHWGLADETPLRLTEIRRD